MAFPGCWAENRFHQNAFTGDEVMSKPSDRVLIVYDSRLGSTGEVAEFIGRVLSEEGTLVDVKKLDEPIADLRKYDRVVVGSAIRYDRWLPEAAEFVRANRRHLSELPTAFFFTCLALAKGTAEGERKADSYARKLRELLPETKRVDVGRFAGVLDSSKATGVARLVLRALSVVTGVKEGDYRDWEAIRAWSRDLQSEERSTLRMFPGATPATRLNALENAASD